MTKLEPKRAQALRPNGRLALFSNVQQPPFDAAETFAEVTRVRPDTPCSSGTMPLLRRKFL